ncbi:histidinol dehydrogenase [Alphaproteobacteria bacterium]|nr:histidinol dehydrogenase [Alphaproteobacteria bacterium]
MVKILRENNQNFSENFKKILIKREMIDSSVDQVVENIIKKIKDDSDSGLLKLTQKYDNFKVSDINQLFVQSEEIEKSKKLVDPKVLTSLKSAIKRIKDYHKRQIPKNDLFRDKHGVLLGGLWNPIESVGLYVPGGTAAYPSSLIMNAVPAIVAGVRRIVMTVPAINGILHPVILACASLLGIKEIYKIGGAQAVAALAIGTKKIKKVDKIVGPGNAYVATAKKKLFGVVGIDMIAGPSEILIIADKNNNPEHIAIDLLSQAEHDKLAQSILITDNENFANEVMDEIKILLKKLDRKEIASESWKNYGVVIISKSIPSSISLANEIAPEHLELAIDNSTKYLDKIKNAGAVFLGKYTPEAIGDYVAGPNHVLPTDRTAKFSSGLNVLDFFKRTSIVSCNSENLKKIGKDAIILANQEGLQAHALSIECRIKN